MRPSLWLILFALCALLSISSCLDLSATIEEVRASLAHIQIRQRRSPVNARVERVIFIKTHKTGSSTVTSILHRYCRTYNKACFITSDPVNHPGAIFTPDTRVEDFFRWNKRNIDIWSQHTRYWPELFSQIVPGGRFLSIVRDPVTQVISAWDFYERKFGGTNDLGALIDKLPDNKEELPPRFWELLTKRSQARDLCPKTRSLRKAGLTDEGCSLTVCLDAVGFIANVYPG